MLVYNARSKKKTQKNITVLFNFKINILHRRPDLRSPHLLWQPKAQNKQAAPQPGQTQVCQEEILQVNSLLFSSDIPMKGHL